MEAHDINSVNFSCNLSQYYNKKSKIVYENTFKGDHQASIHLQIHIHQH